MSVDNVSNAPSITNVATQEPTADLKENISTCKGFELQEIFKQVQELLSEISDTADSLKGKQLKIELSLDGDKMADFLEKVSRMLTTNWNDLQPDLEELFSDESLSDEELLKTLIERFQNLSLENSEKWEEILEDLEKLRSHYHLAYSASESLPITNKLSDIFNNQQKRYQDSLERMFEELMRF